MFILFSIPQIYSITKNYLVKMLFNKLMFFITLFMKYFQKCYKKQKFELTLNLDSFNALVKERVFFRNFI